MMTGNILVFFWFNPPVKVAKEPKSIFLLFGKDVIFLLQNDFLLHITFQVYLVHSAARTGDLGTLQILAESNARIDAR